MAKDKSSLFTTAWRAFADQYERPLIEYFIVPNRKFRADFAFPEAMLMIEVDGGQWLANGGRHNRDSDREKLNLAAVNGWRVMRFSTQQLENDPESCIKLVLLALGLEASNG